MYVLFIKSTIEIIARYSFNKKIFCHERTIKIYCRRIESGTVQQKLQLNFVRRINRRSSTSTFEVCNMFMTPKNVIVINIKIVKQIHLKNGI